MHGTPITDQQWLAFQGASCFPDGDRPLYAYGRLADGREFEIVIDPEASSVTIDDGTEMIGYHREADTLTTEAAQTFLESLGIPRTEQDFMDAGYERFC